MSQGHSENTNLKALDAVSFQLAAAKLNAIITGNLNLVGGHVTVVKPYYILVTI